METGGWGGRGDTGVCYQRAVYKFWAETSEVSSMLGSVGGTRGSEKPLWEKPGIVTNKMPSFPTYDKGV